jgi:hypothetical protein
VLLLSSGGMIHLVPFCVLYSAVQDTILPSPTDLQWRSIHSIVLCSVVWQKVDETPHLDLGGPCAHGSSLQM